MIGPVSGQNGPIGDRVIVTFLALDGTRDVSVSGDVVTVSDVLKIVESAMRGAGFPVPYESLRVVKEGE
jgi:hypothetical protein